jgi:RNA polymerase sigma factor (sigma-70 family)
MSSHFDLINNLVKNSQEGCDKSTEELLEFYQPLIKASVRKCIYLEPNLLHHKEDVASLASLEFIKLIQNYDIDRSFFSYYISNRLFQNLSRACKDLIPNTKGNEVETLFSDMPMLWDPETTDPFGTLELRLILLQAMNELKPNYKKCIEMTFFEHLNQEEASIKMNITQSAFSKRLNKAILSLKKILINNFDFME